MLPPRFTPTEPALTHERTSWAKTMVAHITDRPRYGSPEWARLADTDPRKLAAAIVAAECWATTRDDLPTRLAAELDAHRAAEQTAWEQWRGDHAGEHAAMAKRMVRSLLDPSMRELGRRLSMTEAQRVAEARRPRPGDYQPRPTANGPQNATQEDQAA
ncbi:DUF2742 domain-containing protein [Kribbella sp. NPDC051770]|uniref:DUF2742 domain-containing protein n=1 Tax=Kribbella sp. NPDC051770 TaxID=3155413 RepID=UPI00342734CC